MVEYVHAKLMQLYLQTAFTSEKPWEGWWALTLWDGDYGWRPCKKPIDFNWKCLYAPPHRIIDLKGLSIPQGYTVERPPEDGQKVLVPAFSPENYVEVYYHRDYPDKDKLERLLCVGVVYPDTKDARNLLDVIALHNLGYPINSTLQNTLNKIISGNIFLTNETKDTMKHRLMMLEGIYA